MPQSLRYILNCMTILYQTPTGAPCCFAGLNLHFIAAFLAASSSAGRPGDDWTIALRTLPEVSI